MIALRSVSSTMLGTALRSGRVASGSPARLSLSASSRSARGLATTPPPPPPSPRPASSTSQSQGAPVRRPATESEQGRPQWATLLATSQLIFFGVALLGVGYYIADATHARDQLKENARDYSLQPSMIGIEVQEAHQPEYGSLADYNAAIDELRAMFSARGRKDAVSVDLDDLKTHGISEWSYHEEKRPTVVVWALSTQEVQEIVLVARKYRVPITPFAGGTSLEGHFSSPFGGISLDLSGMDKIVAVSETDGDAVVQAGVKWEDLNAHLAKEGVPLFFPLDPGPGATIGGMAGTGCSGTNAVRYGTAKAEWFLNLTVVLPTGEIIKTRQRARKSSAGWDTTKLFIGAEGTLGIVTEATVRLAPLLPTKCAVVTFGGVEEAVQAATEVVNKGFPVQCVEFLDARTVGAINKGGISRQYTEAPSLFFKFQGDDDAMSHVAKGVQAVTAKHGGANFEFSRSDAEAASLWEGRKAALWSVLALKEGARVWTTDVCVPISKLPRLIRETTEDFEKRGITACHFGHVGDGNVHSLALFSDDKELEIVKQGVHDMVYRAIDLGGTCTGEHGVGIGKVEYLDTELGRGTVNLMETVKRTLDPMNLFNPGKIYPHIKPRLSAGVEV